MKIRTHFEDESFRSSIHAGRGHDIDTGARTKNNEEEDCFRIRNAAQTQANAGVIIG